MYLIAFLSFPPVSGTVDITDINKTATQGDLAYFQCNALGWYPAPMISWTVGGSIANADSYNISTLPAGLDLFDSTSTLGIVVSDSVVVRCLATVPALTIPLTSSAFLTVGERLRSRGRRATVKGVTLAGPWGRIQGRGLRVTALS